MCEEYYGIATEHACRGARGSVPTAVAASTPATAGIAVKQASARPSVYLTFLSPEEAAHFAQLVERAMRAPRNAEDMRQLGAERELVEARFGPIDWSG